MANWSKAIAAGPTSSLGGAGAFLEPVRRGNITFDYDLPRDSHLRIDARMQSETHREVIDTRGRIDGYGVVDATVITKPFERLPEFQVSALNLLDEDYVFPSPVLLRVPGDLPAPGRSIIVGVRFKLD